MQTLRRLKRPSLYLAVIMVFVLVTFSVIQAFNGDHGKGDAFIKEKIVQYLKSKKVRVPDEKLKTIADRSSKSLSSTR